MKLQLTEAQACAFADDSGVPALLPADLTKAFTQRCAVRVLAAFCAGGHDTITRRDIMGTLVAAGFPAKQNPNGKVVRGKLGIPGVPFGGSDWVGDVMKKHCSPSDRRSYWDITGKVEVPSEPEPQAAMEEASADEVMAAFALLDQPSPAYREPPTAQEQDAFEQLFDQGTPLPSAAGASVPSLTGDIASPTTTQDYLNLLVAEESLAAMAAMPIITPAARAILTSTLKQVRTALPSEDLVSEWVTDMPLAELKRRVAKGETLTSIWFEMEIRYGALQQKAVTLMRKTFTIENEEDLEGDFRLALAKWSVCEPRKNLSPGGTPQDQWKAGGYCDKFILQGQPPTLNKLIYWLKHKVTSRLQREGQIPELRQAKGVRTQLELTEINVSGDAGFMHPDALLGDPNSPRAVWVGDIEDGTRRQEFVAPENTRSSDSPLEEGEVDALIIAMKMAGVECAEAVVTGIQEGNTTADTQVALQAVAVLVANSTAVLRLVVEEPYSTTEDLSGEVEMAPDQLALALDFLRVKGYLEAQGACYIASDAGRAADQIQLVA